MSFKIYATALFAFSYLNYTHASTIEFKANKIQYSLVISEQSVSVKKNGAEILNKSASIASKQAVFSLDFNFDNKPDFAILRESGIERYFDVYIFNKNKGWYFLDKQISSLACPSVDLKKKLVLSTCNHASSCEAWQDVYQYRNESLQLIRREGTTCDPITGQGYKYIEKYRNGRVIKHSNVPVELAPEKRTPEQPSSGHH